MALYTVKSDRDVQRLNDELIRKIERIETQSRQIAVLQTEISQIRNPPPAEQAAKAGDLNRSQLKGKARPSTGCSKPSAKWPAASRRC